MPCTALRPNHLLLLLLLQTSEEERKELLSFVICGGGPTGVEVAAEMHDMIFEDLAVSRLLLCYLACYIW
jgi:NADH dehydrogenase FAD-containing subunit